MLRITLTVMGKFTVEHECSQNPQEAYTKIKGLFEKEVDLTRYDSNAKCHFDDGKMCCQIKGGQFNATLNVLAKGPGSKVSIVVDLPFLLMAFKGKIEESLTKMLKKHL